MQNTRLTIITSTSLTRLERFFSNPWRRSSLYIIFPLLGFFSASILSTIAGAVSTWDPYIAGVLLLITEIVNFITYKSIAYKKNQEKRSLFLECLNLFKMGLIYGMFLEAFKLGS